VEKASEPSQKFGRHTSLRSHAIFVNNSDLLHDTDFGVTHTYSPNPHLKSFSIYWNPRYEISTQICRGEFIESVVVFHGCSARLDVFDKWSGHFSSHEGLRLGFCMGGSFFGSRLIFGI
jgi:hypothetical protein